jgi:hypothetical protein
MTQTKRKESRAEFFRKHPNLRTAGWDERDYKLWSQVRQLPSFGILSGEDNRMVSSQAVLQLLEQAAEERFARKK